MACQLTKRENSAVVVHWRYLSPPAWFVRMWHQCELAQNASRVRSLGCSRQDFLPMSISLRDRSGIQAAGEVLPREMPPMIVTISPSAIGCSLDSATFLRLVAGGVLLRSDARA
jgi:hypothetical protein